MLAIEGWARDGLNDKQIAANTGVNEFTFSRWKTQYPQLAQAIKKGRMPVDVQVENALLKRALGFNYEETTTEIVNLPDGTQRKHIKKVTKMVVPDTVAAIFWLKNRKPMQWRDRPEPPVSTEALEKLDAVLANIKGVV